MGAFVHVLFDKLSELIVSFIACTCDGPAVAFAATAWWVVFGEECLFTAVVADEIESVVCHVEPPFTFIIPCSTWKVKG